MSKKKLLSLALVVIMIAILSFSTLAWFSDSDSAKNEFLIAGSDDADPDEIFSVDVWEDKNGDGQPDDDITGDEEGLTYENILPGDLLKKDAFVENTGAYDQYIRVTITISDAEAWINALGSNYNAAELFVGFNPDLWAHVWNNLSELNPGDPIPENLQYVMYLKTVLDSGKKVNIFDAVQIPTSLTQEQAALFEGGFTVDIKADAVQTRNVGVDATTPAEDAAWTAFKYVESHP